MGGDQTGIDVPDDLGPVTVAPFDHHHLPIATRRAVAKAGRTVIPSRLRPDAEPEGLYVRIGHVRPVWADFGGYVGGDAGSATEPGAGGMPATP